jgi:hypothetical protein
MLSSAEKRGYLPLTRQRNTDNRRDADGPLIHIAKMQKTARSSGLDTCFQG